MVCSGRLEFHGHKTDACQAGMLENFFLSAPIQDGHQITKFSTECHQIGLFQRFWLSNIQDNEKVKCIILESLCVLIMNKTSYHPWAICARGVGAKFKVKVHFKINYDFSTDKGRNKCNNFWLENQFLILLSWFKVTLKVKGSISRLNKQIYDF